MKHAKDIIRKPVTLYINENTVTFLKNNITGVSLSQYVDDILMKEVLYINNLDNLYRSLNNE